jgi:hypothetical protein
MHEPRAATILGAHRIKSRLSACLISFLECGGSRVTELGVRLIEVEIPNHICHRFDDRAQQTYLLCVPDTFMDSVSPELRTSSSRLRYGPGIGAKRRVVESLGQGIWNPENRDFTIIVWNTCLEAEFHLLALGVSN